MSKVYMWSGGQEDRNRQQRSRGPVLLQEHKNRFIEPVGTGWEKKRENDWPETVSVW